MRNVLHLIHSDEPGGAESMLLALMDSLQPRGYRCLVGLAGGGWLEERLNERGASVIPLSFRHTGDWRLLRKIGRTIGEWDVSLVHTHLSRMNLYGGIGAGLARVPVVATVHGRDFQGRWGRLGERLVTRFSNRVVAVSQDLARAMEQRGWPRSRLRVIHNGIPVTEPEPETVREEARRELGIEPGAPVIGTVGRLEPVKAYPVLMAAMEQVLGVAPEARVLMVGDGSERGMLEADACERGISHRVIFAGTRTDVPRMLAAMDLFVLCSHSEGLSISLMEAMAAGLPVVATEVGGNPELVEYGTTGLLVPPRDPEMLAAAILFLIRHPQCCRTLGSAGRQRVIERFSADAMAAKYADLYEEILAGSASPDYS